MRLVSIALGLGEYLFALRMQRQRRSERTWVNRAYVEITKCGL